MMTRQSPEGTALTRPFNQLVAKKFRLPSQQLKPEIRTRKHLSKFIEQRYYARKLSSLEFHTQAMVECSAVFFVVIGLLPYLCVFILRT